MIDPMMDTRHPRYAPHHEITQLVVELLRIDGLPPGLAWALVRLMSNPSYAEHPSMTVKLAEWRADWRVQRILLEYACDRGAA